jgi:hypothetical protein
MFNPLASAKASAAAASKPAYGGLKKGGLKKKSAKFAPDVEGGGGGGGGSTASRASVKFGDDPRSASPASSVKFAEPGAGRSSSSSVKFGGSVKFESDGPATGIELKVRSSTLGGDPDDASSRDSSHSRSSSRSSASWVSRASTYSVWSSRESTYSVWEGGRESRGISAAVRMRASTLRDRAKSLYEEYADELPELEDIVYIWKDKPHLTKRQVAVLTVIRLCAMGVMACIGVVIAYFSGAFATTNVAFDPNAPTIGIGGEISDAEMSVFLRNCSCPNDRFFLSELLGGKKIEIELSEDMYMNGMEAEVSVLNDVPTISLKAGYIK